MFRTKLTQNLWAKSILLISLLGIYSHTLAPGLSWANGGSDGGDLIAAAATGGVAHPTGYPLYLLVARLVQYLPVGTLAFRTNLMSAIFASLAAELVYCIVIRHTSSREDGSHWMTALAAGYAFGLAPLVWSQAVITEVYAFQAFLVALVIYLYASASNSPSVNVWRGLALGLALSNHVTAMLVAPFALLVGSVRYPDSFDGWHSWLHALQLNPGSFQKQLLGLIVGLFPYIILPLRASTNPPVNWGDPVNIKGFWWLITGQLYQSYYLQPDAVSLWERLQAGASSLLQQFGFLGIAIGILGWMVFASWSRLYVMTTWIAVSHAMFAMLYQSPDSDLYLIPSFLCFAIWMGLGVDGLRHALSRRLRFLQTALGLFLIIYVGARALSFVSTVDASQDLRAESFGAEILSTAPQNAIIFADGDRALFSLWYFHFALGERPDVMVIAVDLLHFDWYQENLRITYPSLVLAGPFPWPETIVQDNSQRATCYVQYTDHMVMDCSKYAASQ